MTDKVDIAQARIEFATGTVANVTASRVSTERVRKMRFFQEHEYISLDFTRQDVLRVRVQQGAAEPSALLPDDGQPEINFRKASDDARASRCAPSLPPLPNRSAPASGLSSTAKPAAARSSWPIG